MVLFPIMVSLSKKPNMWERTNARECCLDLGLQIYLFICLFIFSAHGWWCGLGHL